MNFNKFFTTTVVTLIAFAFTDNGCDAVIRIQWDKPVYLCETAQLSRYTSYFCEYIGDADGDSGYFIDTFPYTKRIENECCKNACTARFLYETYCSHQNFDLSQDLIIPTTSTTTTHRTTTSTTTKPLFPISWYSVLQNTLPANIFGFPING